MEFPPTLIINLDERKDRWDGLQLSFKDWPVSLERISAVKASPGWKGCYLSHKKCIQVAKERNYPWVLILEDDSRLTETGAARFQSLLPLLWETQDTWDILNGGPSYIHDVKKINADPPIFNVKGYATHFCLINRRSYDTILNFPEKEIDILYSENLQMVCTRPHLAIQEVGKSDITDSNVDYTDFLSESQSILEKEGFANADETTANIFSVKFAMVCVVLIFIINSN